MPTRNINSDLKVNADLTLPSLSTYSGSDVTALMIAGADVVGKRALGTNAFNSTSFLPLTGGTMSGHILLNNGIELRSKDTSSNVKTIARINSSNQLEYGWSGGGPVKFMGGGSYTERMRIHSDGNIGIGTTSPEDKLDIAGKLRISDNKTANTNKTNRIRGEHYDIAQEPTTFMFMNNFSTVNALHIGGGSTIENAATSLNFYTAANNTTTQGSNRMVIDSSGNVGIGTTAPSVGLQLGNSVSGQTKTAIFNSEGGSEVGLTIQSRTNRAKLRVADNDSNAYVVAEAGKAFFGTSSNGDANNITVLTGGNVGIGTVSPYSKLHVVGDTPIIQIRETSGAAEAGISINHAVSGNHVNFFIGTLDGNARKLTIGGTITDGHSTNTAQAAASLMLIDEQTGNVGIGETAPEVKLEVAGDIMAKDSFVSAGATASQGYTFHDFGTGWGYKGVQSPSRLGMFTSGAERVTIDTDGKVGIGTTSPSGLLQVGEYTVASQGNQSTYGNLSSFANSNTDNIFLGLKNGSYPNRGYAFKVTSNGVNSDLTIKEHGLSGDRFTIQTGGNVGIGTTNPSYPLEVAGAGTVSIAYQRTGVTGPKKWGFHSDSSNTYWQNLTDNVLALTVSNAGRIGIGVLSPESKLHIVDSSSSTQLRLNQSGDNDAVLGSGTNFFAIKTGTGGNTNALSILHSNQNVGIGTNSPNEKLEVNGSVRVGNVKIQNANGGRIGLNRNTSTGAIYNNSFGAFQIQNNTSTGLEIQGYNTGGVFTGLISMKQSDGYVGIGTTNPSDKLEVYANGADVALRIHEDAGTHQARLHLRRGGSDWEIINDNNLTIESEGSEKMRITTTGNVGIGITDPDTELEVGGTIKASTHADAIVIGSPTTVKWKMGVYGANDLLIRDPNNNTKFSILSGGNVGIGTNAPAYNLTIADALTSTTKTLLEFDANNITNGGGYNIDFRTSSNNTADRYVARIRGIREGDGAKSQLSFWTENSGLFQRMTIKADGNVGIGTSSPNQKFEVNGGNINIQNGDGGFLTFENGSANITIHHNSSGTDGRDLSFKTWKSGVGNTEKMRIDKDGKVGIGTDNPTSRLTIKSSSVSASDSALTIQGNSNTNAIVKIAERSTDGARLHMYDGGVEKIAFYTDGTDNHISAGNVGIGTASPSYKLHVSGTVGFTSSLYFTNNTANIRVGSAWNTGVLNFLNGSTTAIQFDVPNNRIQNNLGKYLTSSSGTGQFGTLDNQSVAIVANNSTKMTILSGGNVGIGTTSPTEKLHVEGDIELQSAWQIGSNTGSYWQRIRTEDAAASTTNAFNFETRNGSGSFIKHVVIRNDGNVGVGNATPAAKLAVEGTIAHKVYTVATLPSASPAGQRAFVSDSSYSVSAAHGLVTVGSGSNFCPMYSDGTNWRVG